MSSSDALSGLQYALPGVTAQVTFTVDFGVSATGSPGVRNVGAIRVSTAAGSLYFQYFVLNGDISLYSFLYPVIEGLCRVFGFKPPGKSVDGSHFARTLKKCVGPLSKKLHIIFSDYSAGEKAWISIGGDDRTAFTGYCPAEFIRQFLIEVCSDWASDTEREFYRNAQDSHKRKERE